MTKKKIIIISCVIGIIIAGAAFWGGTVYGQNKATATITATRASRGGFGQTFGQGGRAGGGFIMGQVISKDDKSITISLPSGGSKIVFLDSTVKISKQVDGTLADLATGATVQIIGTTNSDGSITATSVQLRPTIAQGR